MEEHEGEESEVENVDVSDEDAEEDQSEDASDTEVLRISKRTCSAFLKNKSLLFFPGWPKMTTKSSLNRPR